MKTAIAMRQAKTDDLPFIWEIIAYAKKARKQDGSSQWQDGYPNQETIMQDIEHDYGYVLEEDDNILFYAALIDDNEPAYEALKSGWLTNGVSYAVIHRMAASPKAAGKGLSQYMMGELEIKAKALGCESIRIDTNFDNAPMLHILKKRGYTRCGKVYFRGSERIAFEKIIVNK